MNEMIRLRGKMGSKMKGTVKGGEQWSIGRWGEQTEGR